MLKQGQGPQEVVDSVLFGFIFLPVETVLCRFWTRGFKRSPARNAAVDLDRRSHDDLKAGPQTGNLCQGFLSAVLLRDRRGFLCRDPLLQFRAGLRSDWRFNPPCPADLARVLPTVSSAWPLICKLPVFSNSNWQVSLCLNQTTLVGQSWTTISWK